MLQLTRPAQDLLMSLCMNCNTHGADDMEVISNLIKIRLKPKVLLNHYMLCVRCGGSFCLTSCCIYCYAAGVTPSITGALIVPLQGAVERTQRQSGHHGEAGDLQWAVQCQESQQHASPAYSAPAQSRTGSKGAVRWLKKKKQKLYFFIIIIIIWTFYLNIINILENISW